MNREDFDKAEALLEEIERLDKHLVDIHFLIGRETCGRPWIASRETGSIYIPLNVAPRVFTIIGEEIERQRAELVAEFEDL